MRRAIISDIHGNLEALEAVLCDIETQRINEIFCLGDVVGFGPNPCECIDRVIKTCRVTLLGNHDHAALSDTARSKWPSPQNDAGDPAANEIRKAFLMHLPLRYEIGPYLFVHGSPRNPLSEYVFPEDIYNHRKMERLFSLVTHCCFQGHTHLPGIITEGLQHFTPDEIDGEFALDDRKVMINVGSVGQPRDGDPRACYAILDDGPNLDVHSETRQDGIPISSPRVTFRRVPYDFEATIRKINEMRPP